MKKAIITILGTAGAKYNVELKKYKAIDMKERATYYFFNDKELKYHNTFPLLIEKYNKNYEIVALYTKEAKQVQKDILKLYNINYNFDDNFAIEDPNDDKKFFSLINDAIKNYDEVIFDVSHGFRHLPLLAIIGLIVENIENSKKIKKILFAQEKIAFKEYVFIDLKEYLNISNIALVLRSFLSTYKVPEIDMDENLYKVIKDFSIHLTSNQFSEIFNTDIELLKKELKNAKYKLFFVNELLEELEIFIKKIELIKDRSEYEQFLFFAKLFIEKGYLLHSSTYLIEGVTYYIAEALSKQNYIDFDITQYANQTKIVSLLKLNYSSKDFKFPNEYFISINIDKINKFYELRENIANIRHNLAHINISKTYDDIENELRKYILMFEELIEQRELYNFDKTLDKKKFTVKFLLEEYEKYIKNFANNQDGIPKLETIIKKYNEDSLNSLTVFNTSKLLNFCNTHYKDISELLKKKKDRECLIDLEEIKKLKLYSKIERFYNINKKLNTTLKQMPNGENREVKKLSKKIPKVKIIQTKKDKELLKDSANKLSNFFNNR